MRGLLFFLVTTLASPAMADCPAPLDIGDPMRVLISQVNAAEAGRAARVVTGQMWAM